MTNHYQRSPFLFLLLLSSLAACTSSNGDAELNNANEIDAGEINDIDADLGETANYFVAEPSEVTAGDAITLRWSVPDGAYCEINPEVGNVGNDGEPVVSNEGTAVVTPNETVEYVLNCPGGRTALLKVTVTVTPAVLQDDCCFEDSDCPPTSVPSGCYGASTEPSSAGHCKMAPQDPNGCWTDSDCGPQETCADAFLCSVCPSVCSVEDQSGFCVYEGT